MSDQGDQRADASAKAGKDMPLEALRGFAAITVLIWHCLYGFYPTLTGLVSDASSGRHGLTGEVWFGLVHGQAAVTLFFVLSGFVLTRRFLLTGDQRIVLRGAVKRWPRLAGPVIPTVLFSWFLFKVGAYHDVEGGALTGSPWLSNFSAGFEAPHTATFIDALTQGAFFTFFRGDSSYDSSLWTMRYEFAGSFVAFGLAMLITLFPPHTRLLRGAMIAVVFIVCHFAAPLYTAFPAGVAVAAYLPRDQKALPAWRVGGLILLGIYMLGYTRSAVGAFWPLHVVFKTIDMSYVHIIASVLMIVAVERASEPLRRPFTGSFAARLGAISFPLYLIHIPILCSFGCWILLTVDKHGDHRLALAAGVAATVVGAFLAAIPLMLLNELWVKSLNRTTDRLLAPPRAQTPVQAR